MIGKPGRDVEVGEMAKQPQGRAGRNQEVQSAAAIVVGDRRRRSHAGESCMRKRRYNLALGEWKGGAYILIG